MSWRSNPKIRALEPYAKQHGYAMVMLLAIRDDGSGYEITTYGRTSQLCKAAKIYGDQLHDLMQSGQWPNWPDTEPAR